MIVLALVPPVQLHDFLATIIADEAPRRDGMLESIRYFHGTYVGKRGNNQVHIPGQFSSKRCTVYLRRTIDSLEGWHCGFAKSPAHPDLTVGCKTAKRVARREKKRPTSRKKYQLISKLKTLVGKLNDVVIVGIHFLDAVAKVLPVNIMA